MTTQACFFHEMSSHPLVEVDVAAWTCVAFLIGDAPMPTNAEMWKHSRIDLLRSMQSDSERCFIDENYWHALEELKLNESREVMERNSKDNYDDEIRKLAHCMTIDNHPLNLGTIEKLNEAGDKFVKMAVQGEMSKFDLSRSKDADEIWKLFRDAVLRK